MVAKTVKPFDPSPPSGLSAAHFDRIASRGIDDPYNAYPHSMAWFKGQLYVGTTRANMCMLKVSKIPTHMAHWPVECPDDLYALDMRARIIRYEPSRNRWETVYRSPYLEGGSIPRDLGYRGMAVFQGESDPEPALYVSTYASAKGPGPLILRSLDGEAFEPVSEYGLIGLPITTIRTLVTFKGRLFTAPTGRAGGKPNMSNLPIIYESRDPLKKRWVPVNEPGFGDADNVVIFEMAACEDHLYAGTGNLKGYQLWRTRGEGDPPYRWEKVLSQGAYRGPLNQGVVSLSAFKGALYVGSGIQNGGIDRYHQVGPAAPELVRLYPDGQWDLIVGQARKTPDGPKEPLSGWGPGFDNPFNGYFWRMAMHEDWLYLGTFDWSLMLYYADQKNWPSWFSRLIRRIGLEQVVEHHGGFDCYRSYDGENWLAVTTDGFGNPYNYGVRSLTSTPEGLFLGAANPFGPRVARRKGKRWVFEDNPRGGCEVWLGKKAT